MKAKVIASKPVDGQVSIEKLIGKSYRIIQRFKDKNGKVSSVQVECPELYGKIILNKGEYKFVKE